MVSDSPQMEAAAVAQTHRIYSRHNVQMFEFGQGLPNLGPRRVHFYLQLSLPVTEVVGVDDQLFNHPRLLALVMTEAPAILEFQASPLPFFAQPAKALRLYKLFSRISLQTHKAQEIHHSSSLIRH